MVLFSGIYFIFGYSARVYRLIGGVKWGLFEAPSDAVFNGGIECGLEFLTTINNVVNWTFISFSFLFFVRLYSCFHDYFFCYFVIK